MNRKKSDKDIQDEQDKPLKNWIPAFSGIFIQQVAPHSMKIQPAVRTPSLTATLQTVLSTAAG